MRGSYPCFWKDIEILFKRSRTKLSGNSWQIRNSLCIFFSNQTYFCSSRVIHYSLNQWQFTEISFPTKLIWTATSGNVLRTCAPCEDSGQPAHSRRLIRIFTGRNLDSQGCTGCGCAGWFESLLGVHVRRYVFWRCVSFHSFIRSISAKLNHGDSIFFTKKIPGLSAMVSLWHNCHVLQN